jgi:hypothetical protein
MWMGRDLSWWSFVLAVAALLLMLPGSMLANMLTPVFISWMGRWSEAGIRRELTKAENKLAEYEAKYEMISMTEDYALQALIHLTRLVFFTLQMAALWFFFHSRQEWMQHSSDPEVFVSLLLACSLYLMPFLYRPYNERLITYRIERSPRVRSDLKIAIEKMRNTLAPKS